MRVRVVTSRGGGTLRWGRDLTRMLNTDAEKRTSGYHAHSLASIVSSPYCNADVLHSTVPVLPGPKATPLVVTVQGDYTIESRLWKRPYRMTLDRADAVTTPSCLLKQKLGLDRAVVVPNAVFPERFNCAPRADKDRVNLVTVCNFHFPDKASGILDIARLLDKIRDQQFDYTVVGGGKYLCAIMSAASKVGIKVHFAGFIPDVRPLLTSSDIFLYYSRHDTFPIAVLEAMASGLPVISNDIGALPEMVNNEGDGYVAHTDTDYLAYLVALLKDKALRDAVGRNARAKVTEKFNWHKIVGNFIGIYNRVI